MHSRGQFFLLVFLTALTAIASPALAQCGSPADLSGDGVVNGSDLALLLIRWNTDDANADLSGDGIVNGSDLALLLISWGDANSDCGVFPDQWINGGDCANDPAIQVHQYNKNTFILRQSLCTNFEAPFIYLLFGNDTVLMEDTGAGGVPIASVVYSIIDQWLADHNQESINLVVAHSHAHGDHVAGDSQFTGQPNTTVVGLSSSAVASFFGITNWPTQIVSFDLGGRILDVIPIPGHQSAHIAFYDRQTDLLLTGDTIYPGRLFISNFSQYLDSIQRLTTFVNNNPLAWIVGTHVEMSNTPGQQFPGGSTFHPDEHPLQLAPTILDELLQGLLDMQANPFIETHDEFVIWPF